MAISLSVVILIPEPSISANSEHRCDAGRLEKGLILLYSLSSINSS